MNYNIVTLANLYQSLNLIGWLKCAKSGNVQTMDFMGKKIENSRGGEPQPIYAKDPNGNIIIDKTKIGDTETIPASFAGDGMINLLGDNRNVTDFVNRSNPSRC